jgi:phage terminase large subunit-like protein
LEEQLKRAARIPALESSSRNLLLNQRISLDSLWLAPSVWKECGGEPDLDVFRGSYSVSMGLDLSMRTDFTAAVLAAKDDEGCVHLLPFVFTPEIGIRERELRDKAPYQTWVEKDMLVAVPGATLDYEWLCHWLRIKLDELGIDVAAIHFDRWRIDQMKAAAAKQNAFTGADWIDVGQGYVGFSPRIETFETFLLQNKLRHGNHPLLNMAASNAIVIRDPAGNRKIDKSKSTLRIDPLVAAVMAVGAFMEADQDFNIAAFIA